MSYLDPSDTIVFRCPQCNQFISSMQNECRFCHIPITEEIISAGAGATFNENRDYRIVMYKNVLYIGIGMFFVGLTLVALFFVSIAARGEGTLFYIGPILVVVGAGQVFVGINGIYREKRSKLKSNSSG